MAGAGLWLRGRGLSLVLPSSTASTSWLPRGEASSCVGLPPFCMLGRWRGSRWGAHGRDGRGSSSRSGRFAGEARTCRRKRTKIYDRRDGAKITVHVLQKMSSD